MRRAQLFVGSKQEQRTKKRDKEEERKESINKNSSCMKEDAGTCMKNLEQGLGAVGPCSYFAAKRGNITRLMTKGSSRAK